MDTPLYCALNDIIAKDTSRFHMPGHKGVDTSGIFGKVLRYDITEITGADSLYAASEAILRCEERIAAYYGAKRSLISCQGSTLCIQTMLALVRGRGRRLVIARNAHVAAANAMALLDFIPYWVYPQTDGITGVTAAVAPDEVEAALRSAEDVAAVYITSPNYYGVLSDIKAIAEVCRRYQVPLLVDNAHGAHLPAAGYPHPITQGAAMCCDSAHKTLPVITGGAYLHIADDEYIASAKEAMAVFGSTSPSYLIMLSIDTCLAYLEKEASAAFQTLHRRIEEIEQAAMQKGFTAVPGIRDGTRLSLCACQLGYTGAQLAEHLAAYAIEPEYVGENTVVLLPSPLNSERDFMRLRQAVEAITPKEYRPRSIPAQHNAAARLAPREAFMAVKQTVPVHASLGRVAAANKSSCPPGVPVVMCGEEITQAVQQQLIFYGYESVTVVSEGATLHSV